jgi:hypothetical protein
MAGRVRLLRQPMECPFCQSQTCVYSKRCHSCGKAVPPGQHLLEQSGVIEATAPDTLAAAAGAAARTQGRYRFAAISDGSLALATAPAFFAAPAMAAEDVSPATASGQFCRE